MIEVCTETTEPQTEIALLREQINLLQQQLREKDKEIEAKDRRIEELEKTVAELAKAIAELKSKLACYENPNTPPSAWRFKKKSKDKTPKKRGAPKGHKGATRPTLEPDDVIEVPADSCEKCGSTNIEEIGVEKSVREDIPPPQNEIKTIQYNRSKYRCWDCGHEFTAKHRDCPQEGRFGVNILTYTTMLKFSLRGVLRKIGDFTGHVNGFSISPKGIQDMMLRVGEACKREYLRILERVKDAEWRYMDETGMKVKGENWWLWVFRTLSDILVVIRPSRGRKVLEEIFGEEINGAGISDGWRAYNIFNSLQRCWAHLLREVDAFFDEPSGRELSEIIHRKFERLKGFLDKDPPMEERKRQKEVWDSEIAQVVHEFSEFEELKKPVGYIKNGSGHWYTCLLYPGMEPTNNLGEQAKREHVIVRKIIGTFRSERGAENYQYIASMFATWKLQGKDVYKELEELLRRELCLGS